MVYSYKIKCKMKVVSAKNPYLRNEITNWYISTVIVIKCKATSRKC